MSREHVFTDDPDYQAAIPLVMRRDGIRTWHLRFEGVELPQSGIGACVWIGNDAVRHRIIEEIQPQGSEQLFGTGPFMEVFSDWQGLAEYYQSTTAENTENPVHPQGPCGQAWIGIARFPLPGGFHTPLSTWPDWTHLYHANGQFDPKVVDVAYDYIAASIKQTGYPKDLQAFSLRMLGHLFQTKTITHTPKYSLEAFPWINDKLVQPQLS